MACTVCHCIFHSIMQVVWQQIDNSNGTQKSDGVGRLHPTITNPLIRKVFTMNGSTEPATLETTIPLYCKFVNLHAAEP
jgi:hypothetical protein